MRHILIEDAHMECVRGVVCHYSLKCSVCVSECVMFQRVFTRFKGYIFNASRSLPRLRTTLSLATTNNNPKRDSTLVKRAITRSTCNLLSG